MKLRRSLAGIAAITLGATGLVFAAQPASAAQTELWVVNAYSYSDTGTFDFTVCLDGTSLTSLATTELTGPFQVETGDHDVTLYGSDSASCSDADPDFDDTVTVPEGPTSTLMIYWPQNGGPAVTVFADDLTCTDAGTSRLLIRNAADTYDEGYVPMDVTGVDPNGDAIDLATDLPVGSEAASDLPAGTYTDIEGGPAGGTPPTVDSLALDEGVVTALYFFGGNDGNIGTFSFTSNVGVCEDPTTTLPPTTTTTVAATQAVVTTPHYTG